MTAAAGHASLSCSAWWSVGHGLALARRNRVLGVFLSLASDWAASRESGASTGAVQLTEKVKRKLCRGGRRRPPRGEDHGETTEAVRSIAARRGRSSARRLQDIMRHGIRHTAALAGRRPCPCVANGRLRHITDRLRPRLDSRRLPVAGRAVRRAADRGGVPSHIFANSRQTPPLW